MFTVHEMGWKSFRNDTDSTFLILQTPTEMYNSETIFKFVLLKARANYISAEPILEIQPSFPISTNNVQAFRLPTFVQR